MEINTKILSIPPYISTSWDNVAALHTADEFLIVSLIDGEVIKIPVPNPEVTDKIFALHLEYMEAIESAQNDPFKMNGLPIPGIGFSLPIRGIETISYPMQHEPSQAQAPDLPPELLEKVANMISMADGKEAFKAEENCNCFHCQLANLLHVTEEPLPEEDIADNELQFQQWDIKPCGDKVYTVTNRLQTEEHYTVDLDAPVSCSCGKQDCEHIVSVLRS